MVSLHVDSHPNPDAHGVATYFYGSDAHGIHSIVGITNINAHSWCFCEAQQIPCHRMCSAIKYGVTSIPMLNVYVNGEVVKTIIGAKPKPALLKELESFI